MKYLIVIHKEKGSAYGVTVPDLPGCFSAGDTLDEAFENAREAIYLHLESMIEDGDAVAAHQSLDAHQANPDHVGGTFAYVDVDVDDLVGPAERINLTVPKRALEKIDAAAKRLGESRSGLMTKASIAYIGQPAAPVVTARLTGKSVKAARKTA